MRLRLSFVFAVFTVLSVSPVSAADATSIPTPFVSAVPEKISRKEIRDIRRRFLDVLEQETQSLRVMQKRARRDGDANRKTRRKDWDENEKTARRKFFAENAHGPERRGYIQEFTERRKAFYGELKLDEKREKDEIDARWKANVESQKTRLNAVEDYLKRSERPPAHLLQRAD